MGGSRAFDQVNGDCQSIAAVYDNLKNKEGCDSTFVGIRGLRNVADPVGLYVLVDEPTSTPETV